MLKTAIKGTLHRMGYTPGYGREYVITHKGWFCDTLPVSDTGPIAILRLDGDWYASTMECLTHLYDRVVPGGFVTTDVRYLIKPAGHA